MKFCTNCGNKLDANAKFCTNCGKQLKVVPQDEQTEQESINHVQSEQDEQVSETSAEQESGEDYASEAGEEVSSEEKYADEPNVEDADETSVTDAHRNDAINQGEFTNENPELQASNIAHSNQTTNGTHGSGSEQKKMNQQRSKQTNQHKEGRKKSLFVTLLLSIGIPLIVLIGVGVGGYFVGKSQTAPEKVVEHFQTAIEDENISDVQSLIQTESDSITMTESEIEEMVTYLADNPDKLNDLIDMLHEGITNGNVAKAADDSNQLLSLDKAGKKYYFFDDYRMKIHPIQLHVSANFVGTEIYVNNTLVDTTGDDPLTIEVTPGIYDIRAVYNGEYGDFENELAINTFEHDGTSIETEVKFDGHYVTFSSNNSESTLYLNGEALGKVADVEEYGPVATNGSMNFHTSFTYPWGEVASDTVSINGTDIETVELNLTPVNDQLADEIMFTINEHLKEYVIAYDNLDPSAFTYMKSEDYLEKMTDNFDSLESDNYRWKGGAVGTEYDLGSITLSEDGSYTANIIVEIAFDSAFYKVDGDLSDFPNEYSAFTWDYELAYSEQEEQWFITNSKEVDKFKTNDRKEFDFSSDPDYSTGVEESASSGGNNASGFDFTIDSQSELEQVLKDAMNDGDLGPFSKSMLNKDMDYVVDTFGEPHDYYNASCTECDDYDVAYYGDYGIDILYDTIRVWVQTDATRSEIANIIGEPTGEDLGMYELILYENATHPLSARYDIYSKPDRARVYFLY
ncbi:zinc-ribbon domain-containing protein [Aquibacillus koreensis]|uniref:Zinc-ribbon domain-containing protein n=1 Tax=Aquibacillus koreensis TaxID=279446 RepID=A0A9X4AHC5_9BACI|nr:zinc ribbon domain-containing protein [Aquibacillus koreensis]MCT2536638.1 zinc-ribbon domain-containing protein [Aquibacillus koreensis]MDC3419977.1 zinc-ribbon domain-containing protein [Aquibacillus koreensis]